MPFIAPERWTISMLSEFYIQHRCIYFLPLYRVEFIRLFRIALLLLSSRWLVVLLLLFVCFLFFIFFTWFYLLILCVQWALTVSSKTVHAVYVHSQRMGRKYTSVQQKQTTFNIKQISISNLCLISYNSRTRAHAHRIVYMIESAAVFTHSNRLENQPYITELMLLLDR